jgi:hypothetical protein
MNALARQSLPEETPSPLPSDALIFEHLGVAVTLCWAELPVEVRDQILNQTDDMIGIAPVQGIRERIRGLLSHHGKA